MHNIQNNSDCTRTHQTYKPTKARHTRPIGIDYMLVCLYFPLFICLSLSLSLFLSVCLSVQHESNPKVTDFGDCLVAYLCVDLSLAAAESNPPVTESWLSCLFVLLAGFIFVFVFLYVCLIVRFAFSLFVFGCSLTVA